LCRYVLVCAAALLLASCALSPEQLSLPRPLAGSSPDAPPPQAQQQRGGVLFGDAGDPRTTRPRVYEGSGEFTAGTPGGGASGRALSKVDGNGVTLNLVGASVQEVAKTVFGDILQVNYTVSDKVKASITLSTAQPVSKDDLLRIFESILRSEGMAISVENGVYNILPADAVAGGLARWASRENLPKAGAATTIVPLRYVSAAEMERILKAVAPQTKILRVDSARNLLLVSGSASELASIGGTVESFDRDWMRGMSFALLPIESADPEAIVKELDTVFANDAESPTQGLVRFIAITRLKSVLVISPRPEYLRKAEGWVRRMDLAGQATEKQVHVYHVRNRPASELALLLQKVYASQGNNRGTADLATQPQQTSSVLSDTSTGTETLLPGQGLPSTFGTAPQRTVSLRRSSSVTQSEQLPDDAASPLPSESELNPSNLSGDQTSGVSIVADEPNNSLIITATHREFKRMRQILGRIDIAANQVLLEATIAEVTLNDDLRYGLKWFFKGGSNEVTFSPSDLGAVVPNFGGFSYFLNTSNIKVALDALSSVTNINVVSSPSMMVLDNKKAVLQIGDEVPIATQQQTGVLVPGAPVIASIAYRSTGVILSITPRIGDNGRIQLDIEQEVSDVRETDSSGLDSPTIAQRRIKTVVAVNDGESIMLAGLMRDRSQVDNGKVPLVGDIPVVGNLFKNKTDVIGRTELFIAITPQVVRDPRQVRSVADEFRDKLNLTTRPQRGGPPDRRENVDRLIVR
jgi:general secretion pathway protein D